MHLKSREGESEQHGYAQSNLAARVIPLRPSAETQAKAIERGIDGVFESFDAEGGTEFHLAVLARISHELIKQIEEQTEKEEIESG